MEPRTQIDLAAEYRKIIKATTKEARIIIAAAKKDWTEQRGREMSPGEIGRHLGWDTLTLPNPRTIQDCDLKDALEVALVKLIEARRFRNYVQDLFPRPKPKQPAGSGALQRQAGKPQKEALKPSGEAQDTTPATPPPASVWRRLRQAFSL